MQNPVISIIVPCFNVEHLIDRCLESLTNQTLAKEYYEIITVNDASTDGTLNKLIEWEKRFPDLISVISYEENLRQGGARNQGIEIAKGEYLSFVDSDDFVNIHLYEKIKAVIDEKHCDEIIIKSEKKSEKEADSYKTLIKELPESKDIQDPYTVHSKKGQFTDYKVNNYGKNGELGFFCHIYKKSILFENDVFFPTHCAYEDNFFGKVITLYIKDTYVIDEVLYYYYQNLDSTVNSSTTNKSYRSRSHCDDW